MIYPGRESKELEFKSQLPQFKNLIKTCVAFANGIGGEIVIGVDDETRSITGIDDTVREKIYESFPNALYDNTQPSLIPQIYEKTYDNHAVIIIKISSTNRKPCFIKAEGIPKGVYCRVGAHTRRASEYLIEELMRTTRHMYYDCEAIYTDIDMLDKNLLKDYYETGKMPTKRLLNDKIVIPAPGNCERLLPTIAGALFFSHAPQEYIPEAEIICTRFAGTKGRDILQSEEITGNILEQANNSFRLVRNWLQKEYILQNSQLQQKTIIPEVALRESINNALLHRKYNIAGAIKIALYDDRLEIFSPGQFPGLVSLDNLGDGTTFLRNPNIVRLARHFGMVEKLGSGIKLIFSSCQQAGITKPKYHEDGDFVKLIFNFIASQEKTLTESDLIMSMFKFLPAITVKDVIERLNVSRNTATRYLNELIAQDKIVRVGKGPAVKYLQKD